MKTNGEKPDIIIADSQYLIVEALKNILEEQYIIRSTANSRSELFASLKHDQPKLLIIDPLLLDLDESDDLKEIMNLYPSMNIVVLINYINKNELRELINLGIKNILHKNTDQTELFSCLYSAERGKKHYSEIYLDMIIDADKKKSNPFDYNQLTTSEIEIVKLIAQGLTTKQIALQKYISFHTVMTHRRNILRKLGVSNASELIMFAVSSGLIDTIEYHI